MAGLHFLLQNLVNRGVGSGIIHVFGIGLARLCRQHNNANMLAIGARVIGPELAKMIVRTFLTTEFEGGRHQKRVDMITAFEEN